MANGTDLLTGKIFPPDSHNQQVDVVRALFMASYVLKKVKSLKNIEYVKCPICGS
ncbi:MAG: hypothetical protein WCE64_01550 [Bacteroidales bacterium]